MHTAAIRHAQLKLALMALVEAADEPTLRALCLAALEGQAPGVGLAADDPWRPVVTAFEELAAVMTRDMVAGLERVADSAGFLAEYAARHGRALAGATR